MGDERNNGVGTLRFPLAEILAFLERNTKNGEFFTAAVVGSHVWWNNDRRTASMASSAALRKLVAAGLVEEDGYSKPPKAYRITPAGLQALKKEPRP